jgi:hypothetical protein
MKDQLQLDLIDLIQSFRDRAKNESDSIEEGFDIGCPSNDACYASADAFRECADSLEYLLTKRL